MYEPERSPRLRLRSERRYLAIAYCAPVLLALITVTSTLLPFINRYAVLIGVINFLLAIFVATLAGLFRHGIEVPVRTRVVRAIGDGCFGGTVYVLSLFPIGMLVIYLGASGWLAFD